MRKTLAALACLAMMPQVAEAAPEGKKTSIFPNHIKGTPYINQRYRYENVDQDSSSFTHEAHASTLRTEVGYITPEHKGFLGHVAIEHVALLGDDSFNSTVNANPHRPTVADPIGLELEQLYAQYKNEFATLKVGRQYVNLDNQRFVGQVGWRQNQQNHDGATIAAAYNDFEAFYGYSYNVNRILGDDSPVGDFSGDIHLFNLAYAGFKPVRISAYAYLLDIENLTALSSSTYGLRAAGKYAANEDINLLYEAEYARQSDYKNNATNYDADYYHLVGGVNWKQATLKVGYEVLGSDNGVASFQTPLATGHKFNGFADKFLATPATGLEDTYVTLQYVLKNIHQYVPKTILSATYHQFDAEQGGGDYGSELDLLAKFKIKDNYLLGLKFVDYNSDGFSSDTQKYVIFVTASY